MRASLGGGFGRAIGSIMQRPQQPRATLDPRETANALQTEG
jgi:hypothetical protein